MSIKTRTILINMLVMSLILFFIIGIVTYQTRNITIADSQSEIKDKTFIEATKIDNMIENSVNSLSTLSYTFSSMKVLNKTDRNVMISLLYSTMQNNPDVLGVWTVWESNSLDGKDIDYVNAPGHDNTGRFVPYYNRASGTPKLEPCVGYDIDNDGGQYYFKSFKSGIISIIGPYKYSVNGKDITMITISQPIKVNGTVLGVVGIDIGIDKLVENVQGLNIMGTGSATLFSNNGTIIASKNNSLIGKNLKEISSGKIDNVEEVLNSIHLGKNFEMIDYSIVLGEKTFKVHVPLTFGKKELEPWSLASTVPLSTMNEKANNLVIKLIIITILGLIIICVSIYFTTKTIINPIIQVSKYLEEYMDLNFQNEININYKHNDEVGVMINGLRKLKENISELIITLNANIKSFFKSSETLAAISEESVASIEEIKSSIDRIKTISDDNLNGTKQAGIALDEMVAGINSASVASNEGAEATHSLVNMTGITNKQLSELIEKINIVKEETNESAIQINQVKDAVKKISDFTRNIETIADQSKMLSLNAAIEAARAGEAGRGFTVVANEVHTLAEASHTAVKEIEKLISDLTSATNVSIKNINNELDQVEDMVKTANETNVIVNEIIEKINIINNMIQNIAAVNQEQTASANEIANLRKLSEESISNLSQSIDHVYSSSEDTTKASEQIAYESQDLLNQTNDINTLIEKFKV